ncbi:MAG TPA: transcription antitermination factor NusB, partial [Bacteroidales bacterium]|nr:transcription antitermination factor NusB [Bacteroidales bacterium]
RFLQNRALLYLCQNNDLLKKIAKYKINWSDETEMLRNFFNEIRNNDDYNKYMNAASTSLNADKEIVTSIISNVLYPSSLLQGLFEEKNLYWSDDFDTAMVMAIKTVKDIKTTYNHDTPLPELFPDKLNETEEKQFARDLLSRTIVHNNEFDNLIAMKADNWELERIALMDSILIKMAISELLYFPSIPIKVSLNEYIELSKQYSSPKSKLFVNGILDKLINDFKSEGKILKTGRGLIEN